jgi:hypothetical protein
MSFRQDLAMALGFPQIRVELDDKQGQGPDDFTLIMQRTLRVIRPYFPMEYIIRMPVPSGVNGYGEGNIDVKSYNFLGISNVYIIKPKSGTSDVALPWSTVRIWEQVWLGKSDFIGTDLLLYKNELNLLNQITNFRFSWKYNPDTGIIYIGSVPTSSVGIGIQGMKGIEKLDDLDENHIVYEYALKYAIALGKQKLGHLWRKFNVSGMDMPGSEVVAEGKAEEEAVMKVIEDNAFYPGGLSAG